MIPLFLPTTLPDVIWSLIVWFSAWIVLFFSISRFLDFWYQGNPNYRTLKTLHLDLEMTERIASSIHATAVVIVIFLSFAFDNTSSDKSVVTRDGSPLLLGIIAPSTAWFVVDILYTLYMGKYVWDNTSTVVFDLVHHVVAILAELQFLGSQNLHGQILATVCRLLLLSEITTPLVNLRWMLIKFKSSSTNIFRVSLLLLIGFLIFRDANCFYMMYVMLDFGLKDMARISVFDTITVFATTCCMGTLNVYWTYLMIYRALAVLRGNSSALHVAESSKLTQGGGAGAQHQQLTSRGIEDQDTTTNHTPNSSSSSNNNNTSSNDDNGTVRKSRVSGFATITTSRTTLMAYYGADGTSERPYQIMKPQPMQEDV